MLALNSQERHATLAKGDGNDHLMLDTDGSAMLALFLRERHVALADGDGGDQLLPQLLAACVAGQVQLAEAGVRGREARCSVIGIIQPIHCNLQKGGGRAGRSRCTVGRKEFSVLQKWLRGTLEARVTTQICCWGKHRAPCMVVMVQNCLLGKMACIVYQGHFGLINQDPGPQASP
eukprot:1161127-Pelagomonas_calceolata.AAC.15